MSERGTPPVPESNPEDEPDSGGQLEASRTHGWLRSLYEFMGLTGQEGRSVLIYSAVLIALVASSGIVLANIWPSRGIGLPLKLSLTGVFVIFTTALVLQRARLQKARGASSAAEEARRAQEVKYAQEREREEFTQLVQDRGQLLLGVSQGMRDVLSDLRNLTGLEKTQDELLAGHREESVKGILKAICRVFDSDRRGSSIEVFAPRTFKATLFEFDPEIGSGGGLRRAYWHYPPSQIPKTEKFDFEAQSSTAAVRCFATRDWVILEDVSEEARKGENWMETRPGQNEDYVDSSMICVPVWGEGERKVRGVLTVDAKRPRYFKNTRQSKEFLSQILGPFLDAIRLAYRLTEPAGR
jgi:hypothetical protein